MIIADNLARLRDRIAKAAARSGRSPESVTLMAVSKKIDQIRIQQAYEAGLRVFGENFVREMGEKGPSLAALSEARWHMIGHLQTNKAKKAAELFNAIDSLDSLRLAEMLNQAAAQMSKVMPALIEIKTSEEESKGGVPAGSQDLEDLLQGLAKLEHLQVCGLMTVPPFTEDPEGARPYFRRLRELRDQIAARKLPRVLMETLSMGMSHDFEVAVEEGSTCVRVGTALFGPRELH